MKPLNRSHQILKLLCVCPIDDPSNKWIQFGNILYTISAVIVILSANIASLTFLLKYFPNDLVNSLFALLETAILSTTLYTLFMAHVSRKEIQNVFSTFEDIYMSSK